MSDKSLDDLRESLLRNPAVQAEYDRLEPEFAVARALLEKHTAQRSRTGGCPPSRA